MQPSSDETLILTVSALAREARVLIEQRFNLVWVEGELSNFHQPGSGHWYFTLKDKSAQLTGERSFKGLSNMPAV